jgi:hypothetical protein
MDNDAKLRKEDIKYLMLHPEKRLSWHTPIFAKRKQIGIALG